jgi:6-phosphofructokinase 1
MLETGRDLAAMKSRRGRILVMEAMGRNVGWLAAATGLAAVDPMDAPQLVLVPERAFDEAALINAVDAVVSRLGYCALTVAEGIRAADGSELALRAGDGRGDVSVGGAGQYVAHLLRQAMGCNVHCAAPDYLQRAASHWVSATDHAQAYAVGRAAVARAVDGEDGVVIALRRLADAPYAWDMVTVKAAQIANLERRLPADFLTADGWHLSEAGRRYLAPLIAGELSVPTANGLPIHYRPDLTLLPRRLPPYRGWAEELVNA